MSRLRGENLLSYCPLQISPLKTCIKDIFETIKACRIINIYCGWIFSKLAYIHCLEVKELIRFDDLDLIFKVTPALFNLKFLPKLCLRMLSLISAILYIVIL